LSIVASAFQIALLLFRFRPHVVVTTGALPGLIAIALAKRLGARTIWIDSIANAEEMSLAGQHARKHADLWLTQWPQVAADSGATFHGALL
jgi:UDP-N-acetylglucosamine:LPS N-acetylglucosamine transferase